MASTQYNQPFQQPKSFISRNLGLIVAISLLVGGWMLVYTFTQFHAKYGASATVIIKDSAITNRYVEPEQYYAMQTTTSTSSNPVLNTMGILKSQPLSDALWVYFSTNHPEELKKRKIKTQKDWNSFYQDGSSFIKAKNPPGTDLITIQFSWSEPKIAQEALGVIVKAFQDTSRDLNKEEQVSRTLFLSRQMGDIEKKLDAIRTKKAGYQTQNATVSIKREGDDLAGSRMELTNKLAQLQAQAQGKEHLVSRYSQMLNMTPEAALRSAALGQDSSTGRLHDELYRLQQQYSLLNSSLTPNNPKVREVQAQIEQVKTNIAAQQNRVMGPFGQKADENMDVITDTTRNTLISDMLKAQGEVQDLHAQIGVLRQRLGQVSTDIGKFPGTAEGLANLEQQEASLSGALDHLRQKVMEGKMKEAQTLSNVFVVDAPRLPDHASFPTQTHLLVLSVVLGLAAGLASAFIKEQFSPPGYTAFPGQFNEESTENAEIFTENEPTRYPHEQSRPVAATHSTAPPVQPTTPSIPAPTQPVDIVPASSSLFDSIVPVAGPMARAISRTQTKTQSGYRRDLAGPLPEQPIRQPILSQSVPMEAIPTEVIQKPTSQFEEATPVLALDNTAPALAPSQAIPVLHAASGSNNQDKPIYSVPVETPEVQEQKASATNLYEAQAKAMPLPRKRRRAVPSFLLGNQQTLDAEFYEDETPQAPYELVPKKQYLKADDNLLQDMEPLPPAPQAPDYPPMPQFVPKEFLHRRKSNLFGGLFSNNKFRDREPELVLGGGSRPR